MRALKRSRRGGFEGDLEALSVVELVQTLNLNGKTARVVLRSATASGALWFRGGAMTHATSGKLHGDLAVFDLIGWRTGRFAVEHGRTSEHSTITGDTTLLLLEGLCRADERLTVSAASPKRRS